MRMSPFCLHFDHDRAYRPDLISRLSRGKHLL